MVTLNNLRFQIPRPVWIQPGPTQLRWLRGSGARQTGDESPTAQEEPEGQLSLLEELFPEEAAKGKTKIRRAAEDVPRLPSKDLQINAHRRRNEWRMTSRSWQEKNKMLNAFRQSDTTVLVLRRASKSLDESDFRRMIPKGLHIEDWKGPGHYLKVIPARDPETLEQLEYYFLLFPNPASAKAYQKHAGEAHRMAKKHMPTNITSFLPPSPGMMRDGVDLYALLQDYTLNLPMQGLSLRTLYPPYDHRLRHLVDNGGYERLVRPHDRTGKAVLLWIEGRYSTLHSIRAAIDQDGIDRGMPWGLVDGIGSIAKLEPPKKMVEDVDPLVEDEMNSRPRNDRWVLTFENEIEARRFVRFWHRRSLDDRDHGEAPSLVHAELLW